MKLFVITKRTLCIAAAALAGVILAITLCVTLISGRKNGAEPAPEKVRDTSAEASFASAAELPSRSVTASGLLTSEDEYEAEVLAGFNKELPVYSVARSDKKIALTIDAAWDDDKTPFILETLTRYDIKATFFLCGFWAEAYPDQVRAIYAAGHSIGNHSMTHPHMNKLSPLEITDEIKKLDDLLEKITGSRTKLFRAPYGEYNDTVITTVRAGGHEPIQWSVDTIDWKPERSSQTILNTVLPKLSDGAIILCHNNGYKIEEYLPTLIETALANGYTFVTVDELLLAGNTIIDVNGVQKTAN